MPTLQWPAGAPPPPTTPASPSVTSKSTMTTVASHRPGGGGIPTYVRVGSPFVRLAGLSGAVAVALGAYGAHSFAADKADMKRVYDTANFYHFVHTLALLAVPMTRRPVLTGTLMVAGMSVFCGTIYYHALTEEKAFRKYTPYGGILLMMAWVSMAL